MTIKKETLAEIITIGDEILIGQIVDTNSAWMGQKLNLTGIKVKQITSVSDDRQHITEALHEALRRADIVLITGGLGPTKDDITKTTLCEFFDTHLIFNEIIYKDVESFFKVRHREVTETNRKQAEVPANCKAIRNTRGTAPGMWFEYNDKIIVSMPGVPYEMKEMMEQAILPSIKEKFELPYIAHKTILTQGIGESMLADLIGTWEDNLNKYNIKLAYLPAPGMVRLRLSIIAPDKDNGLALLNKKTDELVQITEKYVYGYDDDTIEALIGTKLLEIKSSVSVAESCSGGSVAQRIVSVAGSSAYFMGGVVAYDNNIKITILGVSPDTLMIHGAVSEETVKEMVINCKKKFNTDYAIATTGIAGPTGGTDEKPVGTVWIAVSTPDQTYTRKFLFGFNREINIQLTSQNALHMLYRVLTGKLKK